MGKIQHFQEIFVKKLILVGRIIFDSGICKDLGLCTVVLNHHSLNPTSGQVCHQNSPSDTYSTSDYVAALHLTALWDCNKVINLILIYYELWQKVKDMLATPLTTTQKQ